ncbi:hypothetical protein [Microcoleus sp. AT3-D2]|uniref:hypothetical protein n=1 Tax=Microcoleus sp. AT3-D2 TaxID=2818612 RepID=UPI002FD09A3F
MNFRSPSKIEEFDRVLSRKLYSKSLNFLSISKLGSSGAIAVNRPSYKSSIARRINRRSPETEKLPKNGRSPQRKLYSVYYRPERPKHRQ